MTQTDSARPSARRRALAVVSLVSLAALVILVVLLLLSDPVLIIGGVVGIIVAVAGVWWLLTEQRTRHLLGWVGIAAGAVIIGASVVAARSDSGLIDWPVPVLLAVLALAAGTARAALAPEPSTIAEVHLRPSHPVLICNPKSGGGKVEKFGLIEQARELGVEVVLLEPGLDLAELARDAIARGADCLGMAGGDGSQALVASIAVEHGIPFVCISAGTRNHFALDLGLNREDPRTGMVAFRDGVERHVDYATVGDRLFVNNVSLGVYATIVQEDSYRDAKRETTREKLPELLGKQAEPFDLQFTTPSGEKVEGAFLVMVSNNPYVMGPSLDISQRRSMDSGQLGVFAVTASTGIEAGKLVARAFLGRGASDPNLHQFEGPTFEVRSHSGTALAGVDGESLELPTPLQFRIHAGGLRLLVPKASHLEAERRRARQVRVDALVTLARGRLP